MARNKTAKPKCRPKRRPARWEFLYWDADKYHARCNRSWGTDQEDTVLDGLTRTRCHSGTLREACDKFMKWADAQMFNVMIDYEVRDNHHVGKGHDCVNLRSEMRDHPIHEIIH